MARDVPPELAQLVSNLTLSTSVTVGRVFEARGLSVAEASPLMIRVLAGALVMTARANAKLAGIPISVSVDRALETAREIAERLSSADASHARRVN
jgi:hypothetical protein